jgi:hypothetical protein
MIKQHGPQAAFRASERVNDRIDENDWDGRDVWARVVHAIHDLQREEAGSPPTGDPWRSPTPPETPQ